MTFSGVDGLSEYARFFSERANCLQRPVEVRPGFGVNGDDVGTGGGEVREIGIGGSDHQMHVEDFLRGAARTALMIEEPNVMFGTKWPSITSQ